jgi:SAM-dependent methyltransferase
MADPRPNLPAAGDGAHLRRVYRDRDAAMRPDDRFGNIYHPRHPLGRLFRRHNQAVLVDALNRIGLELGSLNALDIGSGFGHWIRHLIELGADPSRLIGIEPGDERVRAAARANPAPGWIEGDGATLPFRDAAFDLVLQVVVMSSVLDADVRARIASEASRVLRTGGHILWIDRTKPVAGRLEGFSRSAVLDLFPGFELRHARPVHPRYFRWLGGRLGALSEFVYAIAPVACESSLYVLRKERER